MTGISYMRDIGSGSSLRGRLAEPGRAPRSPFLGDGEPPKAATSPTTRPTIRRTTMALMIRRDAVDGEPLR